MSVHWGLEADTTMDTTETHLLELVPLMHFVQQWNAATCPAASPWCRDLGVLPSPLEPEPSGAQAGSSTLCCSLALPALGPGTLMPMQVRTERGTFQKQVTAGVPDSLRRHGPNQQLQLCKLDLYISVIKSVSINKDRTCSLCGNCMCQVLSLQTKKCCFW